MAPKNTSQQQLLTYLPRNPTISTTLHLTGLYLTISTILWLPNITNPQHNGFGGHYQFLTMIGLIMTTITLATGFLTDIYYNKQLFALKNILSVYATSVEVAIGVLYWSVYVIDKSHLAPRGHGLPIIPNLGLHAVPAIVLTLDMLTSHAWVIKTSSAMVLNLVFFFVYWAWLEYCFSFNGWYPYPIVAQLSIWQKPLLCIFSAGIMTGSTMVLKWVHGRINEAEGLRSDGFDPVGKMN